MMLFCSGVMPLLAVVLPRIDMRRTVRRLVGAWRMTLGAIGVAAVGASVFQLFIGGSFVGSLGGLAARALAAPAAVSGGYYDAFPNQFAFRGWPGALMFPVVGESIDMHTVSLKTTGLDSNENGSFAATAYSAAGFLGVAVAAGLIIGACTGLDLVLRRLSPPAANALGFANLIGAGALSSLPTLIATNTFGFVFGPVGILILWGLLRRPVERGK